MNLLCGRHSFFFGRGGIKSREHLAIQKVKNEVNINIICMHLLNLININLLPTSKRI